MSIPSPLELSAPEQPRSPYPKAWRSVRRKVRDLQRNFLASKWVHRCLSMDGCVEIGFYLHQDSSLKPGSSMCMNSHSIAASASELPVANNAFWHRIKGKPIPCSWAKAASSNVGRSGAKVVINIVSDA